MPRKRGTRPTTSSCLKWLLATMVQGRWNWGDRGHLIYDFTVSGLLKIKLIGSVCFHRVCSKILVFRPLSSRLTPFFLVWGHVINHSKRNFVSSPLHRKDLSCHRGIWGIFSSRNDHKIFMNVHFVWRLKSGFSSGYSPSQLQHLLAQKHSHSRYHLNNILGGKSAAKSHSKGHNSTKVITRRQICLPSP